MHKEVCSVIWRYEDAYHNACWRDIERYDREDGKIVILCTSSVLEPDWARLPSPPQLIQSVLNHWDLKPNQTIWIERLPRCENGSFTKLKDEFLLIRLECSRKQDACSIGRTLPLGFADVGQFINGNMTVKAMFSRHEEKPTPPSLVSPTLG
jgi:hypothetical protein